ncbi:conserved Plasmodium protein, unknown function [Plasmodium berghei]|uniref:SDE2-like domain-containing protein n=2 Tax=Plasmodium berghei TaxID=5821 RepID=A0A509ABG7_PLABA|nr:conserved Plasmodium protein, unknown function [Plasmodium berghei ANKA]CXH79781.1 conserved Plasmodium protein, unknown function [Plasmodium berghei]SCM18981.1 conserved Plasmodium protein, unknown function [Plasmodium berghei]SCN21523.1 conserved Plasmodium protein, unknown function [Plasmodium berghei]SCO58768.1 conserved Plasmodium protein, unknown function [Plasmodium berghei]SCO58795.1 conserved Plasmodium protein, unknown function [Plasmodium berghei]|eukprot:XP_034419618.1 conserved Plasmodium protein, unknown function [Plasmodium berghei ANKA]
MTSNYIIHMGSNTINKRIKIKGLLSKYEIKILEKNSNAFFYILINLIFNLPVERFRLAINRKYIFLKKRKRNYLVFDITKKLLIMNNIDTNERFINLIENKKRYFNTKPWMNDASPCQANTISESSNMYNDNFSKRPMFYDNIFKNNLSTKYNCLQINEQKDISYYNIFYNILRNDQKECFENNKVFCENNLGKNNIICNCLSNPSYLKTDLNINESNSTVTNSSLFYSNNETSNTTIMHSTKNKYSSFLKSQSLFPLNPISLKYIQNKINELKLNNYEENDINDRCLSCKREVIDLNNNEYNNSDTKKCIIKIKENKSTINIFDEFLDIHVLFRLKGGKGGFGANLRNKKRKKKKKKSNDILSNASRNIRGQRVILDNIVQTTEKLLTKKKNEQTIVDKLNNASSLLTNITVSNDNSDEQIYKYIPQNEVKIEINHKTDFLHNQKNIVHEIVESGIHYEAEQKKKSQKIKTKKNIDKNEQTNNKNNILKSLDDMYTCL